MRSHGFKSQILTTTFFLFFLAWEAKAKKGCRDPTFFDPEFYYKFPQYNSYSVDPYTEHDESLCDPNGIRRRGELNAYQSDPFTMSF